MQKHEQLARAAKPSSVQPSAYPEARAEFIEAMRHATPGTDLPRYVAVLDAILDWTRARASVADLRVVVRRAGVLRCERAGTPVPLWSAQAARNGPPMLEIHVAGTGTRAAEHRADVLRTLAAQSRIVAEEGDRPRLGFGALKNPAALEAVLALLERMLGGTPAAAPAPPVDETASV